MKILLESVLGVALLLAVASLAGRLIARKEHTPPLVGYDAARCSRCGRTLVDDAASLCAECAAIPSVLRRAAAEREAREANPLLWTPTEGEDATKALFPLSRGPS